MEIYFCRSIFFSDEDDKIRKLIFFDIFCADVQEILADENKVIKVLKQRRAFFTKICHAMFPT